MKTLEFYDNFDSNSIDTAVWDEYGTHMTNTNKRLEFDFGVNDSGYSGMTSDTTTYDFTDSEVYIELVDVGDQSLSGLELFPIEICQDTNNKMQVLITGGTIYLRRIIGGSVDGTTSTTYDPENHRWLGLEESGGTVTMSLRSGPPHTTSWYAGFGLSASTLDLSSVYIGISAGEWQNESTATKVIYDNFNWREDSRSPIYASLSPVTSGSNADGTNLAIDLPTYSYGAIVVICLNLWNNGTEQTVTWPTGPNGETITSLVNGYGTNTGDTPYISVGYFKATASQATTQTITATAAGSTRWAGVAFAEDGSRVDVDDPFCSAIGYGYSTSDTTTPDYAEFTLGDDADGGQLYMFTAVDQDPISGSITGWQSPPTTLDQGRSSIALTWRDKATYAGEVVKPSGGLTIAGDAWGVVAFVMKATPPATARFARATGDWDDRTTWNVVNSSGVGGVTPPDETQKAYVNGSYTVSLTKDETVGQLQLGASGAELSLASHKLTVVGTPDYNSLYAFSGTTVNMGSGTLEVSSGDTYMATIYGNVVTPGTGTFIYNTSDVGGSDILNLYDNEFYNFVLNIYDPSGGTSTTANSVSFQNGGATFTNATFNKLGTGNITVEFDDGEQYQISNLNVTGATKDSKLKFASLTSGDVYYFTGSSDITATYLDLEDSYALGDGTLPTPNGSISSTTYSWSTLTGAATSLALGDDDSSSVSLGFTFNYLGTDYTSVSVGSNGILRFGYTATSASGQYSADLSAGTWSNYIAGLWTDLNPSVSGTIKHETLGTSPNRIFVAEYDSVPNYDNNSNLYTFQIKLFEGSNNIEFHIQSSKTSVHNYVQGLTDTSGNYWAIGTRYATATTIPDITNEGTLFTQSMTSGTSKTNTYTARSSTDSGNNTGWTFVDGSSNFFF